MKKLLLIFCAILLLWANAAHSQQGIIYGMTAGGGPHHLGVIYKMNSDGSSYTVIHSFSIATGFNPSGGSLVKANDNMLYGLNQNGGSHNKGCIFKIDPVTNVYSDVFDFDGTNGASPLGNLILASNGLLYGVTYSGGANNGGVLFSYNPTFIGDSVLHDFSNLTGWASSCTLVQATDGKLYGTTETGGAHNNGVIFRFNLINNTYDDLLDFNLVTWGPIGGLMQASNGLIYGTLGFGTKIFKFNPANLNLSVLSNNNNFDGYTHFVQNQAGNKIYALRDINSTGDFRIISLNLATDSLQSLYTFIGTNGDAARDGLTIGEPDIFYGITYKGGANDSGVVFSFNSTNAVFTKLHDFVGGNSGSLPYGNLYYACNAIPPATPGNIIKTGGTAKICTGDVRTYTVPAVSGVTYFWTAPSGAVILSGQGTNSIQLSFPLSFPNSGGTLQVTASNGCSTSNAQNLVIQRNIPSIPSVITVSGGSAKVCPGDIRTYSVIDSGLMYNWVFQGFGGANILSGQGTHSVQIQYTNLFSFPGQISVTATNNCGISNVRNLTVNKRVPAKPGTITGPNTVCKGSTHVYTIASVVNAISYSWTLPPLATIQGPSNDTSIVVKFSNINLVGGQLSVKANSACGSSPLNTLSITVNCRLAASGSNDDNYDVNIFPNPAHDKVTMQFSGTEGENYFIKVLDLTGRILMNQVNKSIDGVNQNEIDLTGFAKGMYFISLQTAGYSKQVKLLVE